MLAFLPILLWNVLSILTRCSNQRNPRLMTPGSRLKYRATSMSRCPASSTAIFAIIQLVRLNLSTRKRSVCS